MSDPKPIDPANPEPSPEATVRLSIGAPPNALSTQSLEVGDRPKPDSTQKLPLGAPEPPMDQTQKMALPRMDEPPIRVQKLDSPAEAVGQTLNLPTFQPEAAKPFGWKLPVFLGLMVALGVAAYLVFAKAPAPTSSSPLIATTSTAKESVPPAVQVYLEQAKAGDVHAMRMLGAYYYYGLNVPQDREKGLYWYRMAAEKGSDAAKADLKQIEGKR